jgi:uncharacterized membrane protein YeaQ/YmgE (transglycosylase-associated protein family)
VLLALAGGAVTSWVFWAAGISPEAGLAVLAFVAFVGAALLIVAQRTIYPAPA